MSDNEEDYTEYNTIIYTNIHHLDEEMGVSVFYPSRTIAYDISDLEQKMLIMCQSLTLKAQFDLKRDDVWFDFMVFGVHETQDVLRRLNDLFGEGAHPYGEDGKYYH